MEELTDVHVLQCEPEDIVRYLEDDDRLAGALDAGMFDTTRIEFRYGVSVEPKHDSDEQPILNTNAISDLVESKPVHWNVGDVEIVLLYEGNRGLVDQELKAAFGAFDRPTPPKTKDPRAVWEEHNES